MKRITNYKNGFTLIELVVVFSIMVIISGLALFNYSSFRSNISLDNLSQEIALTMRQAQVYALGVHGTQIGNTGNQFPAYGIHFRLSTNANDIVHGNTKSFVLFADLPPSVCTPPATCTPANQTYDEIGALCSIANVAVNNECLQTNTIASTDYISGFCVDGNCDTFPDSQNPPTLDIVFTRPNPDAHFFLFDKSATCSSGCTGSSATITIKSATGATKAITIWNTGIISIQ